MKFTYERLQITGVTKEEKEKWLKKSVDLGFHTLSDYLKSILASFEHKGYEVQAGKECVCISSFSSKIIGAEHLKNRSASIRYFINERQ